MMMIGLFLSKFDREGLAALGFTGFWEAYNTLAFALGGKPKTINNYRDEFDPCFSRVRKGWGSRPLRPTRQKMLDRMGALGLDEFARRIREAVSPAGDVEPFIDLGGGGEDAAAAAGAAGVSAAAGPSSFSRRLMTGLSAENYFQAHYAEIGLFASRGLTRTTHFGCGFDFRVGDEAGPFYAVEVKGLSGASGTILLTDKEHAAAGALRERYFLFLVRDFSRKPFHTLVRNPLRSELSFSRRDFVRHETQWVCTVHTPTEEML